MLTTLSFKEVIKMKLKKIKDKILYFIYSQKGQATTEYILLAVLLALVFLSVPVGANDESVGEMLFNGFTEYVRGIYYFLSLPIG